MMSNFPEVVWVSASSALRRFDQPLLRHLASRHTVAHWEYSQSPDEASSLETAVVLLHDYLKHRDQPVHLIGHSTGALVALIYARRYPARVRSLTLLGVGVNPGMDWKAHYYVHRELLPCSRQMVLTQLACNLFGSQSEHLIREIVAVLEQDLDSALSIHSLVNRTRIAPGGIESPLMVCGSQEDIVIDPQQLQGWRDWLKAGDRLWECPEGSHFFHYFHPQLVGEQILGFWQSVGKRSQIKISA